jgi:hypothetical protein
VIGIGAVSAKAFQLPVGANSMRPSRTPFT